MKIPFYQTEWLGLDLSQIAQEVNLERTQPPHSKFYGRFYEKFFEKKQTLLSAGWLEKKSSLSNWLHELISSLTPNASILSIGCGLGIVEALLIQKGLKVDLQEGQPHSVAYMKKNHPQEFKKSNFILSENLSNISSKSYDIILVVTSTYGMDEVILNSFLKEIHRIMKPGGIFVWYETSLTWADIKNYIKMKIHGSFLGILWGWKRSFNLLRTQACKNGFTLMKKYNLDQDNKEISTNEFMGIPIGGSVVWQVGVYRK